MKFLFWILLLQVYNNKNAYLYLWGLKCIPWVHKETSSRNDDELCTLVPPNTNLTPGVLLFRILTARDSSYVVPPTMKTITSWTLGKQNKILTSFKCLVNILYVEVQLIENNFQEVLNDLFHSNFNGRSSTLNLPTKSIYN